MVVSLQEIREMSQEEAEKLGVGRIKKMWHEDLEREYLKRQRKENDKQQYKIEARGFDSDGKADVRKMKECCKEKSIPLPKALKDQYTVYNIQ